jgi:hypothetical protein
MLEFASIVYSHWMFFGLIEKLVIVWFDYSCTSNQACTSKVASQYADLFGCGQGQFPI